jgi:hypothetical protein
MLMTDVNKDYQVTEQEFNHRFDSLYTAWANVETKEITINELRDGINNDVSPLGPDPTRVKNDTIPN